MKRPVKTEKITNLLRDRFLSGYYPGKSRLPEERALAAELKVSRNTIRAALNTLEQERLIRRYSRLGTFLNIGNQTADDFCYYILPSHDICDPRRYKFSVISPHFYLMGQFIHECDKRNLPYSMIPLSNDNIREHLLAERLWNLPQNAKLLLTGAHWYESLSQLFIDKGFRVAMLFSSMGEKLEKHPGFCFINTRVKTYYEKGIGFLQQLNCKRILFVIEKRTDLSAPEGCTVFQVNGREGTADNDKKYDPKKITAAFRRHKCDGIFLLNFDCVKEYRSINALLDIPEDVPVLIGENVLDVSSMANPPYMIGVDREKIVRLSLDFLYSDSPGDQIDVNDIVIYDKEQQPTGGNTNHNN